MKYLFSIAFLALTLLAVAQKKKDPDTSTLLIQPERIEFDVDIYGGMDYEVINGEEAGLLVAVMTDDRSSAGYNWTFHLVDTLLNLVWTRIYPIPYDCNFTGTEYHDGKFYLLFTRSEYGNEELLVLQIDPATPTIEEIDINTVFTIQLSFFEILDNNIILAGYTNFRPVMLTFDLDERKPNVIPGFYDNNSDILDVIIDDEAELFTVIESDKMSNRKQTIRAKTFTASGILIQNNVINPGDRRHLIDGASTIFYGGFQYLAGTYSKKSTQFSRGLYLSKFVNGRQQFVKYHDYADLDNFFGYMKEKREQRIKERIQRKRAKGKEPRFNYRLVVHDMIQRGDEYILIAEAYYPSYSTNYTANDWTYSSAGSAFRGSPYQSIVRYRYTHAIVVSFDRNGNINWDASFEIDDVETSSLHKYIAVSTYEDKIILVYLEENTIRSKVIQGDEILEGKSFSPVRLAYEKDEVKVRDPEIEIVKEWYGGNLFAYGEQRIRNENSVDGKQTRRVFYINKIVYHEGKQPN